MYTTVQELRKKIRQARRRISRFEQKKSAQQVLNLLIEGDAVSVFPLAIFSNKNKIK